jgi:hypothetical protein
MEFVADVIDRVICNVNREEELNLVKKMVEDFMTPRPLFQ